MTDYADGFSVGQVFKLGLHRVELGEMIAFAREWDPQPFHVDPDAARATKFGEIIASGLYTMAVFQRMAVRALYSNWAVVAGRRMRNVEMLRPVRGGDELAGSVTITALAAPRRGRTLVSKRGLLQCGTADVLVMDFDTYVQTSRTAVVQI